MIVSILTHPSLGAKECIATSANVTLHQRVGCPAMAAFALNVLVMVMVSPFIVTFDSV